MSRSRAKKANQAKFSSGHISYTTEIAEFLGQLYDKEEAVIVKGYEKIRQFKAAKNKTRKLKNPILGDGNPTPREVRIANRKRRPRDVNNVFIANDIEEEIQRVNEAKKAENSKKSNGSQSSRSYISTSRSSAPSNSVRSLDSFRSIASNDSNVSLGDLVHLERLKKNLEKKLAKVNNKILAKINDVKVEDRFNKTGRISRETIRSARS